MLPPGALLAQWDSTVVESLHDHLYQQLDIVDRSERARHSSTLNHLLVTGYRLGWTVLREALRRAGASGSRTWPYSPPRNPPWPPGSAMPGAAWMMSRSIEPPARGAVRLCRGHAEGRDGRDRVEIPRRRSGARGTVRRSESAVVDRRRPALSGVAFG
jgi:hypothetical protein